MVYDCAPSMAFEQGGLPQPWPRPAVSRLAAILAADMAGYSQLMGTDEEGTHERLKAYLREPAEP